MQYAFKITGLQSSVHVLQSLKPLVTNLISDISADCDHVLFNLCFSSILLACHHTNCDSCRFTFPCHRSDLDSSSPDQSGYDPKQKLEFLRFAPACLRIQPSALDMVLKDNVLTRSEPRSIPGSAFICQV